MHKKLSMKLQATPSRGSIAETGDRRSFLQVTAAATCGVANSLLFAQVCEAATVAPPPLPKVLSQIEEARSQLEPIPALIKQEKWDTVRSILVTPPLSECWSKTGKLLKNYALAIGEADMDELAALELKEDAEYHLRFLDMAAYNNVFNPIRTEGEAGASKELIKSYYEDPVNEYKKCAKIFNDLIGVSTATE